MSNDDLSPDDLVELTIGPPAHGGHCVARHEGRVVFVRHTLPAERILARITGRTSRFWRAEAVRILEPADQRVDSHWPEAGPGGVGGGELAHVAMPAQREWKREVVVDTLGRIGRIDTDHPALQSFIVRCVPVPGHGAEAGYRTRVTLMADDEGRAGMYRHRSNEVLPLDQIPLAHPRLQDLGLLTRRWPAGARITAVAPSDGEPVTLVDGAPTAGAGRRVREIVRIAGGVEYAYRVRTGGFWQVHVGAPATLVEHVLATADLRPGEGAWDLYSGAGLFTTPLAAGVGADGRVDAVEGDREGAADARRNAHGVEQIALHSGEVAEYVRRAQQHLGDPDVVVLDPPRTGAGTKVMEVVLAAAPRRIVYVACDPAALARDVATARAQGYEMTGLAGFDLFPHTHHVECIATLDPAS